MSGPELPREPPNGRDPVEELAEAFLERYRRGERPALSEFVARAPEHAEEIRELFPALVLMEQANPAEVASLAQDVASRPPERVGDYRILREVGRGGMGIVYEAVQEKLNRHVALKILPTGGMNDPHRVLRFRREARSAARLHHTNIVPVFDVGEREGVHYYAMQFIHGQSLDAIIQELKRRREAPTAGAGPHTSSAASGLAESLLTGRFRRGEPAEDESRSSPTPEGGAPKVQELNQAPGDNQGRQTASTILSDGSASSSRPDEHYYRSVARIGLQAASALGYAHRQRTLHRDIKPSNLLLDLTGIVWVTDFGLAKEEGDDLTHTGDVVGTLRYIAPERFGGKADARSDIYSLGLTLYEMLALRPAFGESDRVRLVNAIGHREPQALRKVDPRLPRDLETVILKAIRKEPAGRYVRAEDLEEDLRRYLSDRPIGARRAATWERVGRWCRRNPGWAGTIGAVIALLMIMATGGTLLSVHLLRAVHALQIADAERTEKLWQAHLERARALRWSGRVGQRFEALGAVREAARIKVTPELRDEAVAALILPDIEVAREWEGYPEETLHWAFDARFQRYARISRKGYLSICQLTPGGEKVVAQVAAGVSPPFWRLWMSPDGRYVACAHSALQEGIAGGVRVWKIDGATPEVLLDEPRGVHLYALTFHADGRRLAIGHPDGAISIYDLQRGSLLRRVPLGQVANTLAYHPGDGRLAAACGDSVRVVDLEAHHEVQLRLAGIKTWANGLAWHPDGRLLAATSTDRRIHIWDTVTQREAMSPLAGHAASGIFMAFNPRGDRLISTAWDHMTRLWDVRTGQQLLEMPGDSAVRFGLDGLTLGVGQFGSRLRIWRLADGRELRRIQHVESGQPQKIFLPMLDADGRTLVAAVENGLGFFDINTEKELAFAPLESGTAAVPIYLDRARGCITSGYSSVAFWPTRQDASRPERWVIGPPQILASASDSGADVTPDGRIRVVPQENWSLILDRDRPGRRIEAGPQYDVRHCAISPDGRWVVGCSWWWDGHSRSAQIWDGQTGRHVRDLPIQGPTTARFSPDGRWLATWTLSGRSHLWDTATWRLQRSFEGVWSWVGVSGLLAIYDLPGVMRLVEPESGREFFRLTGPEPRPFVSTCMTADGSKLVACTLDSRALYVWDLRLIREELRALGMDWDAPDFKASPGSSMGQAPLTIQLEPGVLRRPPIHEDALALATWTLNAALWPLDPDTYFERAYAADRLHRYAEAVADYERFLALAPRSDTRRTEVQLRLALDSHDWLSDDRKAMVALAAILDAPLPTIPWPGQCAQLCNDVAWQAAHGLPSTATPDLFLRLARKAVELEPYNPMYQSTLGVILYRLGSFKDAIRCLEANLPRHESLAAFDLYLLAMSYQRLGSTSLARQYFSRASLLQETESNLFPIHRRELRAFRTEAEQLLGLPKG